MQEDIIRVQSPGYFEERGGLALWLAASGFLLLLLAIPTLINPYYLRITSSAVDW